MSPSQAAAEAHFRAIASINGLDDHKVQATITFGQVRALINQLDHLFHQCLHPATSPPVTLETVGQDFYCNSPMARGAVRAGIQQEELIRILLSEVTELQKALIEALSNRAGPPLKFGEAPAKDPNMPELLLASGKFSGTGDCITPSVDIPALEDWPDFTIDWRQEPRGGISDVRFTKGVARYSTPWWRKLLLRLLPGGGWTYVRFGHKP